MILIGIPGTFGLQAGEDVREYLYAPIGGFIILLAQGWRFPGLIVEPMAGHHGTYSILLARRPVRRRRA